MSVIRAAEAARSEDPDQAAENVQYVFTMTDGGFAKRSRISDYRLTNRGTKGVKAMTLANEDRGVLVGGFIVEDGDEILSITQGGQVVRSPINENFRPTGRSTMGVKFVTPKNGDAVAVVARSVEAQVVAAVAGEEGATDEPAGAPIEGGDVVESSDEAADATIESDPAPDEPSESES